MFDPQTPIENEMQVSLIVVPIVFSLLACVAVGLRVLARRIANRCLDASDHIMFAALAVTVAFSGLIAAEPFTGAGMHLTELVERYGNGPIVTYTKMTIANQILWATAVCLPKVSILLLYSRIFTMRNFILGARVTGGLVLLLGLGTVLGALFQCQPFAFNWDTTIAGGHCSDQVLSFKITGVLNVVLDVVVLLLPMPHLFALELAPLKKAILMVTFALGLITCIFSALRIHAIATLDYSDITYLAGVPSIYSVLEPTLAITLACVPVLRPLLGGTYSKTGTRQAAGRGHVTTTTSTKKSVTAGKLSGLGSHRTSRTGRFEALGGDTTDDDASDRGLQLQPIEYKQHARISAREHGHGGESLDAGSEPPRERAAGIVVTQGWEVNVV